MATQEVVSQDGRAVSVQGNRASGALVVMHEIDSLIEQGFGYHAEVGNLTTGITGGGAGTIFDLDQPELVIGIPSGTVVMPIHFIVVGVLPVLVADNDEWEAIVCVDTSSGYGKTAGADGTSTTETVFNLRTDLANNRSLCEVRSAFTADMTTDGTNDPVLDMTLDRVNLSGDLQSAVGTTLLGLKLDYQPRFPPRIAGPATILVYWGGTSAITGYCSARWVEYSSAKLPTA